MNIEEPNMEESIRLAGDRIFHFHVADSNRWYPGAGHLDFVSLLGTLYETGYQGFVSASSCPSRTQTPRPSGPLLVYGSSK